LLWSQEPQITCGRNPSTCHLFTIFGRRNPSSRYHIWSKEPQMTSRRNSFPGFLLFGAFHLFDIFHLFDVCSLFDLFLLFDVFLGNEITFLDVLLCCSVCTTNKKPSINSQNVSLLPNLLAEMPMALTFENFYQFAPRLRDAGNNPRYRELGSRAERHARQVDVATNCNTSPHIAIHCNTHSKVDLANLGHK